MKRPVLILVLLLGIAIGAAVVHFGMSEGRSDGRETAARSASQSGPSAEMMGAMHRMHEAANKLETTGDVDRDFVALMIPHHQSAVEMARVYLRHGKDPGLRRLSENIVASQEAEIRQMHGRGHAPAPAGPAAPAAGGETGH